MAYTSEAEVQTAIYGLLVPGGVLDTTLAGLGVNAVYDFMAVPQNAAFDYLTLGDGYEIREDTMGAEGHNHGYKYYASVHLWSAQKNNNAALAIDRVNALLTNKDTQPWTLATLTHVYTFLFRSTRIYDQGGVIPVLHINHQYLIYTVQS